MDEVLHDMPDEIRENFKREKVNGALTVYWHYLSVCLQIHVSTIPLLTDKELEELGVKTIGDRAVWRKRCREAEQGILLFSAVLLYIGIIKVWVSST